ncbi:TPA: hypothetical protein M4243_004096 [Klebsiella variicola]|uniref:hypothetical protein n=1 Tax=Klebsiella pneumoniae complex TaxID=3390273 RepID=UPI0013EF3867|nr:MULTISPECIES: hypothetical protein [Klebsiella]MCB3489665.1 hypothetical protein [Klebsiella variicola]MDV0461626.1 hypothetical protein [Klebsiella quasipneumoniae subsp. similipneumoniae]MDV0824161.1 hypothetical protein [Klebsiella quasipneumoniae subsp. similipneumoniae]MDV0865074.1 hypothetical protein [Klebsiella quasipneumoniae subsp. similipneumoniae]HDK6430818.1 hypothetical protein [Klebsiella variicola]
MKDEQQQYDSQPAQSQKTSPCALGGTFSMEKKALTAEQYRDWQFIAETLREKISRYVE